MGVSHSHFLGGPAVWSEQDRAKALSYAAFRAEHCSGCGTRASEWTVDDQGVPTYPYIADLWECPGCEGLESLRDQVSNDPDRKGAHGLKIRMRPNPAVAAHG